MTAAEYRRYPSPLLRRFIADVLSYFDLRPDDAALGAEVVHDADLAGIDTHGIANLAAHAHYTPGLRDGEVVARAPGTVLRESPVSAAWDSGGGFGPVIAHRAMASAIAKAQAHGVGMVSVRDGRHFGANGYFAEMAARQGLIGMAVANTPVVGFPPDARGPVVGTNPIAFAAPVPDAPPLVVDVALTAVSGSKVVAAASTGEQVPAGWLVDLSGHPTRDSHASVSGGGLQMLGGQLAGHKGYSLALMVETLGILAGNGPGFRQAAYSSSWSQGQWFAAWRVDLFIEPEEFLTDMRDLADFIHSVPARPGGGILLPGERRAACRAERTKTGVPIRDEVVGPLRALSSETGAKFPNPIP